jgi:hypothetical protein
MKITHIMTETYVNAVGTDVRSQATKQLYMDQVWDVLQSSYAAIGGLKGNGFNTKEEMLKLPMWKLGVRQGVVHAVIIYKDKIGRKSVAAGTDSSEAGGWFIKDMFANEMQRSYGEKSKAVLGMMMKLHPFNVVEEFLVSPERVGEMSASQDIIAIADVAEADWPGDAKMTLAKYPKLIHYGYLREIGGKMIFKVMIGTPDKTIK